MGNFRELRVWEDGINLATEIYSITREEPFRKDFGLCNQIQRAAVSISSNIAEGDERGKISIGGYEKPISKNHIGQIVKVRFIPSGQIFQVTDLNGIILKYFTIPDISIKFIINGGATSLN